MKTTIKTAQESVLEELLKNLNHLASHQVWSIENPEVIKYMHAMNQPHRVYHGWSHLLHMLEESRTLPSDFVKEPMRLQAAILFHDVVYAPCASNNELESIVFASQFYRWRDMFSIEPLIMATTHTFPFVKFGDDRDVICDLDLAILGADKDRFAQYRFEIWQEYRGYCSDEDYDNGTRTFFQELQGQATRDYLYRTSIFRNRYEEKAREKIKMMLVEYVQ